MNELMVAVERAVRPVLARPRRKLRMREELLAHLTAVYEQERAALGDDRLALARAVRRLGEPAELTRELQASVPRLERWLAVNLSLIGPRMARRFGAAGTGRNLADPFGLATDSPARHAFRTAACCAAWVFFPGLAAGILSILFVVAKGEEIVRPGRGAGLLVVLSIYSFVAAWFCVRSVRAASDGLRAGQMLRAAGLAAAFVLTGAAVFPVLRAVQPDNPLWSYIVDSPDHWAAATGVVTSWVVFPLFVVRSALLSDAPGREWAALEIGV